MENNDKLEKIMSRDADFYWKRYKRGKDYIDKKNLIRETTKNWNFYIGKQWEGLETGGRTEPPFLNFIKRHVDHKVSSISQTSMTVRYSDLEGKGTPEVYEKLGEMYEAWREKGKLNLVDRLTMKEAAITGEGIQYFGTGDVRDVQRLDNTNVFYGDESEYNIQRQPYITIVERLSVEDAKRIAIENERPKEEIECITADFDTQDLVGNQDELEGDKKSRTSKVTALINLERIDGIIYTCRSTKNMILEEMHPLTATNELGSTRSMTMYPLVKMIWEDYPNDARGVSEVKPMIANQIELNQTLARMSIVNKQMAFPRLAILANSIVNESELNKVGGILKLNGEDKSIQQIVQYLQPAQMSSEPREYANNILSSTQELSGSGETTMGNINPNRVAASAYTEIRDQANLILGEKEERAQQFVEDRALLFVEMWSVYCTDGLTYVKEVVDEATGNIVQEVKEILPEELDILKPDVKIDVTRTDAWSKEAEQEFVDSLLDKKEITLAEATDLYSEAGVAPVQKLRQIVAKRKQAALQQQMMQQQMMAQQNDAMAIQNEVEQETAGLE